MDQVLSQEEIDALLNAMNTGEISEDTEKQLREGIEVFRKGFIKRTDRGETADEAGSETK